MMLFTAALSAEAEWVFTIIHLQIDLVANHLGMRHDLCISGDLF